MDFGVGIDALGIAPSFGLAMVVMFGLGAATAAFQSMNSTLTLAISPSEYHLNSGSSCNLVSTFSVSQRSHWHLHRPIRSASDADNHGFGSHIRRHVLNDAL